VSEPSPGPQGVAAERAVDAVVFDWGGVLTTGIDVAFTQWAAGDGVDPEHLGAVLREAFAADTPDHPNAVHALERGDLSGEQFEQLLARQLAARGSHVPARGLLARMFAHLSPSESMLGLAARLKDEGLRTAVLSNSWGNGYPDEGWDELFDVVVISGDVGMRKPEPRIYHHVLGLLDVLPHRCAFVDDLGANVRAAAELGMVGVHHRSYDETVTELEALTGRSLR
jgi:epoxide hydrolase-like predicted phosphatase